MSKTDSSKDFKVGIIGAGWIAEKAAQTLAGIPGMRCYAIASRSLEKASAFARQWGVERAYGSYAELLDDGHVDLVYVATPHSHHYDVTCAALDKGLPCLVEKAFMANAAQTGAVVEKARRKGIFLAEAIWTRYQPVVPMIRDLLAGGRIGCPKLVTATLAYNMEDKERILRPELCGGALLDLGVYLLNFLRMFFDGKILKTSSQCELFASGTDKSHAISVVLEGGIVANLTGSACCAGHNIGVIAGTGGALVVDNVNNPQQVQILSRERMIEEVIPVPAQITGYEYEFMACRDALAEGLTEAPQMPLDETLCIMELMDGLRREWGVHYPMDDIQYPHNTHNFSS